MGNNKLRVFSQSKVGIDRQKLESYIRGEPIFPTTIEFDLTQLCSRSCLGCPYSTSRRPGLTLQIPFLDRLFSILGPNTPGLIISGGEATIVPHFPETVAMAKRKGFQDIAVISNGAKIDRSEIQAALMEYVTSIRISMYEWQENDSEHFTNTLKKIEDLRNCVEREGSKLEIGASILTRQEWNHRYEPVGQQALGAGIHWLYFHPYCVNWHTQYPVQADQTGVLGTIQELIEMAPRNANIQVPFERYYRNELYFEKLHGAHFLIQVGADGINYLGPECKYEKDAAILDLNDYLEDDFLWHPQRVRRIDGTNSDNYSWSGTRHRPPMFSDYIQKVIRLRGDSNGGETPVVYPNGHLYPNII